MRTAGAPKNFLTAPGKKGYGSTTTGHLFTKGYEYMSDPFERAKDLSTVNAFEDCSVSQRPFYHFSRVDGTIGSQSKVYLASTLQIDVYLERSIRQ